MRNNIIFNVENNWNTISWKNWSSNKNGEKLVTHDQECKKKKKKKMIYAFFW